MNVIRLLDFLFSCRHSNLSRVFTIDKRTYRVCCDCGAQFDYSLERMAVKRRRTAVVCPTPLVGKYEPRGG